ncbi:TetR family transcriptional regulator [Thermogemmatispora aurantia]|uniref:TetR/AcrR family transcriptional regulator n=2 Tax=Thermogemmatispora TaxID=768669 RepID=UPI00124E0519|nr:TetR family transcriptional regulator [Thermogemmatispora aurantia]GER84477.1 TetR family transcriptional regulator [Thermogemmatispora aurantia]
MTTPANENDPRVKRTRQLLLQAFSSLLEEGRTIHSIRVADITERATVNRATFYAHFEDKYALLEVWMREKFHHALESQLPATSTLQMSTLRQLLLAVFDFLALWQYHLKPADRQFVPFFEVALQQELQGVFVRWLNQVPSLVPIGRETVETTAQVISWAIFGPAVQWSRGDRTIAKDVMAQHVLAVVIAGLSPIVSVT